MVLSLFFSRKSYFTSLFFLQDWSFCWWWTVRKQLDHAINIQISLLQHSILLPRRQFLVLPQFHVGPESDFVLVEYWLTCFHQVCRIFNYRHCYFCCCCLLLLIIRCHQSFLCRNKLLQYRHNRIFRYLLDFWFLFPRHVVRALVWL